MQEEESRRLRGLLELSREVDDLIEQALTHRESLEEALRRVLPVVCERAGARAAFVQSFSEDLRLRVFAWPDGIEVPELQTALGRTDREHREDLLLDTGHDWVVARPLDVAGEWFGALGLVVPRQDGSSADLAALQELLLVVSEELDNFLHSIRATRQRHLVLMQLGDALRNRVLRNGLLEAVRVLVGAMPIQRLLLAYIGEEDRASAVHVQVFDRGELVFDTMRADADADAEADAGAEAEARADAAHGDAEARADAAHGDAEARADAAHGDAEAHADAAHSDAEAEASATASEIASEATAYVREGDRRLAERFGFHEAREEVLINGVTHAQIVGKVLATSSHAGFNIDDRELLAGFAGFIRQRVVDFHKEWRTLARSFRPDDVTRLLGYPDYVRRYLSPREGEVAILYADICGFTRLSEQVLRSPAAVAELVELWGRETVEAVWKHGGVFDKMVGDCVIGLFGPPFYETDPAERLAAALRCAREIRSATGSLPERCGLGALQGAGLAVSIGVNLAPLFVGQFGPNDNFTGFSSGMNNAARLQGCAARNEILVMADPCGRLREGHDFAFGPETSAKVKNVADPLRFRALL